MNRLLPVMVTGQPQKGCAGNLRLGRIARVAVSTSDPRVIWEPDERDACRVAPIERQCDVCSRGRGHP
jgi:hypothetical protein